MAHLKFDELMAELIQGHHLRETRIHQPKSVTVWNIAETNADVYAEAAQQAIRTERVERLEDGLFGDGQIYRLKAVKPSRRKRK